MLSRLDWMVIKPSMIVDVGCGTGELAKLLQERYPQAQVVAIDTSAEMLSTAQKLGVKECRQEEASKLSLPDHSVDLLCANFLLPWVEDWASCLKEWRRVLAPNGILMVSILGVGTLPALQNLLPKEALPRLFDMHDLGDEMVKAGFADPVLDAGRFPVRYRDKQRMQQELHASGLLHSSFELPDISLEVIYEVVHGHAFAPMPSSEFKADEDGMVRVPLAHLRRRREMV